MLGTSGFHHKRQKWKKRWRRASTSCGKNLHLKTPTGVERKTRKIRFQWYNKRNSLYDNQKTNHHRKATKMYKQHFNPEESNRWHTFRSWVEDRQEKHVLRGRADHPEYKSSCFQSGIYMYQWNKKTRLFRQEKLVEEEIGFFNTLV